MSKPILLAYALLFLAVLLWAMEQLGVLLGVSVLLLSFPLVYGLLWLFADLEERW